MVMKKNYNGKRVNKSGSTRSKGNKGNEKRLKTYAEYEDQHSVADNDVAWYSNNPQLLHDTANIPFNRSVGVRNTISVAGKVEGSGQFQEITDPNYTLPGVLTIEWMPSVGVSEGEDSVVNIAAKNLYSFIRQANSGAKNYDSTDLMLYILAMDSCYAFHSYMMRLYGTLMFTVPTQRYLPNHLTRALGGDYEDLVANMANFRAYINSFGARLGAMAVPNDMYYFTRHRWMSANVYADEVSVKPQIYAYVPSYLFKFSYDKDGAGQLKPVPITGPNQAALTLANLKGIGDSLLAPIIGDEDFNIMSGDILKAYGGNIVAIPTVGENYVVPVSYSSEVLDQIHNIQYMPHGDADVVSTYDVHQDTTKSFLISSLKTGNPDDVLGVMNGAWMDSGKDLVTPQDTMIMSRLINCYDYDVDTNKAILHSAGSEIVTGVSEWGFKPNSDGNAGSFGYIKAYNTMLFYNYADRSETSSPMTWVGMGTWWSRIGYGSFDRAPLCGVCIVAKEGPGTSAATKNSVSITGQKNNMTFVTADTIKQMHDTALLSMFNVPAMGVRK